MSKSSKGIQQQRVGNDESLELVQRQMRYIAHQQRRSAPPRCHPISIYILVQASGCLFAGMTMIVTSFWPGTGSRSSEILKIVGPILMCLGAILMFVGIILARFLKKKETKIWDKKVSQHILSASRQVLDQSITQLHTKQVLGPATEEERRELLESPESIEARLAKKSAAFALSDSDTFNSSSSNLPHYSPHNEDVPDPLRIKKVKKKPGSSSSFENLESVREDRESGKKSSERLRQATSRNEKYGDDAIESAKQTTKTTTTTVTTRRVVEVPEKAKKPKHKPPPAPPAVTPESPRLRVKVKASPGTSVNIRHSGSSYDDEVAREPLRSQELAALGVHQIPATKPKPKVKSRKEQTFDGTDI